MKSAVIAYAVGQARVPAGSTGGGQFAGGGGSTAAHSVDKRGAVKVPTLKPGKAKARHKVDKRGGVVIHHPAYPDQGYQTFRQVLTTAGQVLASRITGFA